MQIILNSGHYNTHWGGIKQYKSMAIFRNFPDDIFFRCLKPKTCQQKAPQKKKKTDFTTPSTSFEIVFWVVPPICVIVSIYIYRLKLKSYYKSSAGDCDACDLLGCILKRRNSAFFLRHVQPGASSVPGTNVCRLW